MKGTVQTVPKFLDVESTINLGETPEVQLNLNIMLWKRRAEYTESIPKFKLRQDQVRDLIIFLEHLQYTEEFQTNDTRPLLAKRVINAFSLLANQKFRDQAITLIEQGITSCHDRTILTMNDLDTLKAHSEALDVVIKTDDPKELEELGMKMMRQEAVEKIAKIHMRWLKVRNSADWLSKQYTDDSSKEDKATKDELVKLKKTAKNNMDRAENKETEQKNVSQTEKSALMMKELENSEALIKEFEKNYIKKYPRNQTQLDKAHGEQIEVQLAFEIGVGRHLKLPGQTHKMLYHNCAEVPEKAINQAVQQIEYHCSDPKNIDDFFKKWEPWQLYQCKHTIPKYDALELKTVKVINFCNLSSGIPRDPVALVVTNEAGEEIHNQHYSYAALRTWYLQGGNNPLIPGKPIDWASVKRLEKEVGITEGEASSAMDTDNEERPSSSQEPGARSQKPGARSQEPEARSQKPEARSQKPGA